MPTVSELISSNIGNGSNGSVNVRGDLMINVKDFGAKGDGVKNDTEAILKAIAKAKQKNTVTVAFPSGTYKITSSIKLPSNIRIIGYNATLKVTSVIGKILINEDTVNGNENISIEGLTIVGPGNIGVEQDAGIHLVKCRNSYIENCKIYDVRGDGITLGNITGGVVATCENIKVRNCYIDGVYRQGVALTDAKNCTIENNTIINCNQGSYGTGIGIDLEPNFNGQFCCNNLIVNNYIINCGAGIYLASVDNVADVRGNKIESNRIDTVEEYGIKAAYSFTDIINNKIFNAKKDGIAVGTGGVVQINSLLIEGNSIEDAGLETTGVYSCIRIKNVVHSNVIGNIFTKKPTTTNKVLYGFSEDTLSSRNTYLGNHFRALSVSFSVQPTSKTSHNHVDESVVSNKHEGFVSLGNIILDGNSIQFGPIANSFSIYHASGLPSSAIGLNNDIAFVVSPSIGSPVGYKKIAGTWYQFGQIWHLTSIASIPEYIGQEALVSGVWYKAIGTSSLADWKQITN